MKKIFVFIFLLCFFTESKAQFEKFWKDSTVGWALPDGATGGHLYGRGRILLKTDTNLIKAILGTSYILNGTSQQTANFNISGKGQATQHEAKQAAVGLNPTNYSYESQSLSPSTVSYTIDDWTDVNGFVAYPPSLYGSPTAPDGLNVGGIETSGYHQTTTYAPGAGTFTIKIYVAYSGTKRLQITVNGNVIYNDSTFTGSFVQYTTSSFTVPAGNNTLKIETFGGGTIFWDKIETVSPAPMSMYWAINGLLDTTWHIAEDGKMIYHDTNEGEDKVLTSDANGKASWQNSGGRMITSSDIAGQTSTQTVLTYTTPNDGFIRVCKVSSMSTITAVSAGVLTFTLVYTDETNTSRTLTFFSMGSTTAGLSVTGKSNFPAMDELHCYPNTAITITATLTVGTATYNASSTLTLIRKIAI